MEHYSALKKEILAQATIWMNFEDVLRSEINQSQKGKYSMIPLNMKFLELPNSESEGTIVVVGS
jgi:hypothetical protein